MGQSTVALSILQKAMMYKGTKPKPKKKKKPVKKGY
jgi:hypothetical protein